MRFITTVVIFMLPPLTGDAPGRVDKDISAPATHDEIAALIRDLGDPSYERRTYATRRLCAIGPKASEPLRAAAKGDDAETALRAGAVLAVLERLMFTGVEIRLSPSRRRIAWNDSIDMNVKMTNHSEYPARVPFDITPCKRGRAGSEAEGDARQVGVMLDLSEWLHVRGPDGREIDMTVDDIAADAEVVAAVQERLNGGPIGVLQAGESVTVTARAFNRGWARYRLLDAGVYTVAMEYVPAWDDEVLAGRRVGRVASNEVQIHVTTAAPQTVSRAGQQASLFIERQGRFIVARVTNRTDQTMVVNGNFGKSPPFAEGRWVYEVDDVRVEVPVEPKGGVPWHDFDPALLVEVNAGRSIELARASLGDLRKALSRAGAKMDGTRWTVHFTYASLCDRRWQTHQGTALLGNSKAPAVFRSPLPRRMLSTRLSSNRLTAPAVD